MAERVVYRLEQRIPPQNSILCQILQGFDIEQILYMMATTRQVGVQRAISSYVTRLRFVQPVITGADLKRLGILPGPIYREILDAVRDAKRNGQLDDPKDELALAQRMAAAKRPPDP